MNASQDVKSLFLEEFVKRIIIKSIPPRQKKEVIFEKLEQAAVAPPRLEIKPEFKEIKTEEKPKVFIKTETPKVQPAPAKPQAPAKPVIRAMPLAPAMPPAQKIPMLDRITRIFADPGIQSLNCPGPDKKVLITRFGLTQTAQFSFGEDEIKEFMKDLSEKTRIPLIPGLIKVIYQNLIITAVLSEFIGTKFVVERRRQVLQIPSGMPLR